MDCAVTDCTRAIVFDLRNCLTGDSRFKSAIKVLHDVAVMARCLATKPRSGHFGISFIREDCWRILLPLPSAVQMSVRDVNNTFFQLNEIIDSQVDDHSSSTKGKVNHLAGVVERVTKSYQDIKDKNKGELYVTVMTLEWYGSTEQEIDEYMKSNLEGINTNIQVIEIAGSRRCIRLSKHLCVNSYPARGISIYMESIFKEWIKESSGLVLVLPHNVELYAHAYGPVININSLSGQTTKGPDKLTVSCFVPANLCQSSLHSGCKYLIPAGQRFDNQYRWEAFHSFVCDRGLAAIVKDADSPHLAFVMLPGRDQQMILQPVVSCEQLLHLDEIPLLSHGAEDFEFVESAEKLPTDGHFLLGPEVGVIQMLKRASVQEKAVGQRVKLVPQKLMGGPAHPLGKQATKCPGPETTPTRPSINELKKFAHPALGMYRKK